VPVYLDSSAVVKLIIEEAESRQLEAFLDSRPELICSALTRLEVNRGFLRTRPASRWRRAEAFFLSISVLDIDAPILARAAALNPPELRSLDAIHLATALSVPELEGMVVYDRRLARAAAAAGLRVWAPGQA